MDTPTTAAPAAPSTAATSAATPAAESKPSTPQKDPNEPKAKSFEEHRARLVARDRERAEAARSERIKEQAEKAREVLARGDKDPADGVRQAAESNTDSESFRAKLDAARAEVDGKTKDAADGAEAKADDAAESAETKPEDPFASKVKFKADGQEYEMTVGELVERGKKSAGLERALGRKLEEVARERKQVESEKSAVMAQRAQFNSMLKDIVMEPGRLFELGEVLGIPAERLDEITERRFRDMVEWEKMSPDKKEAIMVRKMLQEKEVSEAKLRKELEAKAAKEKAEIHERAVREKEAEYARTFTEGLKSVGLEADSDTLRVMAMTYRDIRASGVQEPNIAEVARRVKDQILGVSAKSLAGLSDDEVYNALPPEVIARIYKRHNAVIQGGAPPPSVVKKAGKATLSRDAARQGGHVPMSERKMTFAELREHNQKKYGSGT